MCNTARGFGEEARVGWHNFYSPAAESSGLLVSSRQAAVSSRQGEEHWVELDLLGLMQQLGVLPEPEQSEEASPT